MNINKQRLLFSLLSLSLAFHAQSQDWQNPHILGLNKLPYHVTLGLPSLERGRADMISLDGDWSFHFVGHYRMHLSEYQHDYARPQDNGNRCEVNYLTLSSESGKSVRIESQSSSLLSEFRIAFHKTELTS